MHKNEKLAMPQSYTKWMLATLPANIAYAPLSSLVPLYILSLGGSALYVAVAVMGFNAVAMVMTFVWGEIADTTVKKKPFIMLSYIGITALLFIMYFANSVYDVAIIYASVAIFQAANTTPYNLLVMETDQKENWSKSFSRLQAISGIGMVIGLLIAAALTDFTGLRSVILVFAVASLISTLMAQGLLIEPLVSVKTKESRLKQLEGGILQMNSIVFAMLSYPFRFINLYKHILDFNNTKRRVINSIKTPFAMLCISWLFFNVGLSMVNTEYAASLHIHGLSESTVFFVIMIATIVQVVLFYYARDILYKDRLYETTAEMIGIRSVSYVFIGISFLFAGLVFLLSNLVLYALIAGYSYPLYYTASYIVMFLVIGDNNRGSALGIYNGVGWLGYFLGSLITGLMLLLGFTFLYIMAGIVIAVSFYAFTKVLKPKVHGWAGRVKLGSA